MRTKFVYNKKSFNHDNSLNSFSMSGWTICYTLLQNKNELATANTHRHAAVSM